ncbi:MAG: hypothetical protein ABIO70_07850 [Pseudomonadota bacterium]
MPHQGAAILLPVLLLAAAWLLTAPRQDAGLSEDARAVEAELRAADPELLLLGASTVHRSVDPEALGPLLDDPPVRVGLLAKGSTMPPVWYVLVKERVFDIGLRPRVVVIGSTPRWLMTTEVGTVSAKNVMAEHQTRYDPVVAEKAYHQARRSPAGERLERARSQARAGFQDLVREWSVGLLFGDGEGSVPRQGQRVAEPAPARIFGAEDSVDLSLQQRVIPVVDVTDEVREEQARIETVADSFVPDLVELCAAHDARVVFVWVPYPDFSEHAQQIPPAQLAGLVAYLNEVGAGWLDLHALAYGDELFFDWAHMNARGRERFTRDLAHALKDMEVMGTGPFAPAQVPFWVEHSLRREGSPAPLGPVELRPYGPDPTRLMAMLPAWEPISNRGTRVLGAGPVSPLLVLEDGAPLTRDAWALSAPEPGTATHMSRLLLVKPRDPAHLAASAGHFSLALSDELPVTSGADQGFWLYPGTSLVVDLEPSALAGLPVRVTCALSPVEAGAPPVLTVAGQAVPLQARGDHLVAELSLPLPAGAWELRLTLPPGAPLHLVRWIGAEAEGQRLDLLGREAAIAPPALDLLAQARRGKATVRSRQVQHPLEGFVADPEAGVGEVAAPAWAFLSNPSLVGPTHCPGCSPLRLYEDGVGMKASSANCRSMAGQADQPGRFCQQGDALRAVGLDGSLPGANAHHYTLGIDPARLTWHGFWLAPGDVSELPAQGWQTLPLRHGATTLALEGHLFGGSPEATLSLDLEVAGEVAWSAQVALAPLAEGPLLVPLSPPLDPGGRPVVLRLGTELGAPFALLNHVELRE